MKDEWTGHAIGIMHVYGISPVVLAERIGWHPKYLSAILNCKRRTRDAEEKVMQALTVMVDEMNTG